MSKEEASQALRDSMGDLDSARKLLRRRSEADAAEGAGGEADAAEGGGLAWPDVDATEHQFDDDDDDDATHQFEDDVKDEDDDDDDDEDDDDDDFEAEFARPKRKRARAGGGAAKRQKLTEEEKASRKAARKAETERRRAEKKKEEAEAAEAMRRNRERIKAGNASGASSPLAPYAGQSSLLGEVKERLNFSGTFLYHRSCKAAENDYGVKVNHLYTFVVGDTDIVQWWTTPENDERALLRDEGTPVDFAATVKKHAAFEGVDITTVTRLKVHVVDGDRVAKTPKLKAPAPKGGVGRVLDGDDDDDDAAADPAPPPSSEKKPRVPGGAARQKKLDKQLLAEADVAEDAYEPAVAAAADQNKLLRDLALERARRRAQGK